MCVYRVYTIAQRASYTVLLQSVFCCSCSCYIYVCVCASSCCCCFFLFFCLVGKNREHNKFVTEYNTKTGAEESKNYK